MSNYSKQRLCKIILSYLEFVAEVAALFPPPPPNSYKHQFYDVMSGFTRLLIKTKYVCCGPVSPHANFLVNRFVGTVILLVKIAGGGKGKRAEVALFGEIVLRKVFDHKHWWKVSNRYKQRQEKRFQVNTTYNVFPQCTEKNAPSRLEFDSDSQNARPYKANFLCFSTTVGTRFFKFCKWFIFCADCW